MSEHACGGAKPAMPDNLAEQFPIPPIHPGIVHVRVQCVQGIQVPAQTPMT